MYKYRKSNNYLISERNDDGGGGNGGGKGRLTNDEYLAKLSWPNFDEQSDHIVICEHEPAQLQLHNIVYA